MKRITILTGSECRHTYFRKYMALAEGIQVTNTYCEGLEKSMRATIASQEDKDLRSKHLAASEQSEIDFFQTFIDHVADCSYPSFLSKGEINSPRYTQAIIDAKPDLLITCGSSLIREPLLSAFEG